MSVLLYSYYSSTSNTDSFKHGEVEDFCVEYCNDCKFFAEIFDEIRKFEIKNSYRKYRHKKIKANSSVCIRKNNDKKIFESVKNMEVKLPLHHFHIRGEIYEYVFSFCNLKVKENKQFFPLFAHNLFGFNFFFFVKGVRLCVWQTKNYSIGGNNLKDLNFANIGDQVKFIETVRYHQLSLAGLAATTTPEEESANKYLCKIVLTEHDYFSEIWPKVDIKNRKISLEILALG